MRYAMVDDSHFVVNIAVWDGVSEWNPEGVTLIALADDQLVEPGYFYDGNGQFVVVTSDGVS